MASLEQFIVRMRYWCSQANLGYSQEDRWNIRPGGNCDCSSIVIFTLREAGFDTGAANYTGNLSANLTQRGWQRLPNDGNPMPGDILLNDADHVAVYLGNGMLAQASQSETNSINGASGNQTGRETNVSHYYNFPWDCYLRYPQQSEDDMALRNDPVNLDGKEVTGEYALQAIIHNTEVIYEQNQQLIALLKDLPKQISDAVWFGQSQDPSQNPLYQLRDIQNTVKAEHK